MESRPGPCSFCFFFFYLMSWCCSEFGPHQSFTRLIVQQNPRGWGSRSSPASDGPAPKLEVYRSCPPCEMLSRNLGYFRLLAFCSGWWGGGLDHLYGSPCDRGPCQADAGTPTCSRPHTRTGGLGALQFPRVSWPRSKTGGVSESAPRESPPPPPPPPPVQAFERVGSSSSWEVS